MSILCNSVHIEQMAGDIFVIFPLRLQDILLSLPFLIKLFFPLFSHPYEKSADKKHCPPLSPFYFLIILELEGMAFLFGVGHNKGIMVRYS